MAFARAFGLLYPPPTEDPWRESLGIWARQVQAIRLRLGLYADVQAAMADRTEERLSEVPRWK